MKMNFDTGRRGWERPAERSLASAQSRAAGRISHALSNLESLKSRMLDELIASKTGAELAERLRCAADESASLAWATPYPLLLLPELLVEKTDEAQRQFERQQVIRSQRRNSISMAA